MPVERLRRGDAPYFLMARTTAQDDDLALDRLGLLAHLLSRPEDWEVRHTEIARRFKIGRQRVRDLMSDLEKLGYISREAQRDESGKILGWVVTVHPFREREEGWSETDHPPAGEGGTAQTTRGGTDQTGGVVRNPAGGFQTTNREEISTEDRPTEEPIAPAVADAEVVEAEPLLLEVVDATGPPPMRHGQVVEAIATVCGIDLTAANGTTRKRLGRQAKVLMESHPTLEDFAAKLERYGLLFPDAALTPEALGKHWDALTEAAVAERLGRRRINGRGGTSARNAVALQQWLARQHDGPDG